MVVPIQPTALLITRTSGARRINRQRFKVILFIALIFIILLQYMFFHGTTKYVPRLKDWSTSLFKYEKWSIRNSFINSNNNNNSMNFSTYEYLVAETKEPDSLDEFHSSIIANSNTSCIKMRKLFGYVKTIEDVPPMEEITKLHPDLQVGGHFIPNCTHTDKVAILVPFRDRMRHLEIFLFNLHPILKRQLIEYQIFVIEQSGSDLFNRAMLFNVGFKESLKRHNFTCFIFHDVDLVPENDQNIYSCPITPRHMSVAVSTMKYKLPYRSIFGGISALRKDDFIAVNGFSNRYWGWGAEDDDMANRIAYHGLYISRYSPTIGRYKMLKHKHQKVNFNRYRILQKGKQRFSVDGLSNLNYSVEQISLHRLYTLLKIKLVKT